MRLDKEKIVAYLEQNTRERISSYQLVQKTDASDVNLNQLSTEDLFRLDEEIFEIGKKNGFLLSKRHHYFDVLGMPWNIDFEIVPNDDNYFEDELQWGSYVKYQGKIMIAHDFWKYEEEGLIGLVEEGAKLVYDDEEDSAQLKCTYVK